MSIDRVIERFGIYFAEVGFSKTYGRLFGYFMTASEPASMGELVTKLQISKSTASTEFRRLLATGVIEKVLVADERAVFYRLKSGIWSELLKQKTQELKKLRSIAEEVPSKLLKNMDGLQDLVCYCDFMESKLEKLASSFETFSKKQKKKKKGN
jgi:DNA-binding transcriptional regulator GbsR (MarR family)